MKEYIVEGHISSAPRAARVFAIGEGEAKKRAIEQLGPKFMPFRVRLA